MELLSNNIIREDVWSYVKDDDSINHSESFLIFSWDRLSDKDLESFSKHTERGVSIANDVEVEDLSDCLFRGAVFTLVDIELPVFSDGRAFSQASKLRTELNFQKTIRARGHIIPDQAAFLMRCGVDSIVIDVQRFSHEIWKESLKSFSHSYQRAGLSENLSPTLPSSIIEKRLSQKTESGK